MPADRRATIAAIFDRAADTYDDVGVEFFKPIAERLVAELAPRPGERALDVGCGRGAALFALARAVGPSGRVVGTDLAPAMVAATVADAVAAGLDVEVRVDDAQDPNLADETFDVVASSLVLFFLPDPVAALRAWRSRLVPGGRVGVSTFGEYTTPAWSAVDELFAPYLLDSSPDAEPGSSESPYRTDAGVERLLVDAGFTDVRTALTTVSVRFRDEDHWYRWTWSQGHRGRWEAVPPEQRDAVRDVAYAVLDGCRDQSGRIGFDQVARFTLGRKM